MTDFYSKNASKFIKEYESIDPEKIHATWLPYLTKASALILDVGAGSGRDAAWLAGAGHEVVAVEPSDRLREEAKHLHPIPSIQWINDTLPKLKKVRNLGYTFDLILLSAVWIHVHPKDREVALRNLSGLLKPGGHLVISLRHGPSPDERAMYPGSFEEIKNLSSHFLFEVVSHQESRDELRRSEVSWSTVVLRLTDDGTASLPLLRHIIINDSKSSTYKLALLRILLRIADGSQGVVMERDENFVTIPFGLVAFYWVKAFKKPVLELGIRQQPSNAKLSFDKDSFKALAEISPFDLKIGARFEGDLAENLTIAIREARNTIKGMPAFFITYPNSDDQVFPCKSKTVRARRAISLDMDLFRSFGTFKIPTPLWDSMSQHSCWIEPAILKEWASLMVSYEKKIGVKRTIDEYLGALAWLDADRDTRIVRRIVDNIQAAGKKAYCVWTGKRLSDAYEIDHCFPFKYWANNDLWNLVPSSRKANNEKRDRLPSAMILEKSKDLIINWWESAYRSSFLEEQFLTEATTALPFLTGRESDFLRSEAVFKGVQRQRIRLKSTQQIAEWDGV